MNNMKSRLLAVITFLKKFWNRI